MTTTQCGTLSVAFCKSNPELNKPEPIANDNTPDKSINWLLNAYPLIAIAAVVYSAPRFVEWVVEMVLRFVG